MKKNALVFGAGRIGRGFVGQLLFRSGYSMTFVDAARPLVEQLNTSKSYPVTVLGSPPRTESVTGFDAVCLEDRSQVVEAVSRHNLFFTAVGGANLGKVGELLAEGLARRLARGKRSEANVILCENWKDPALDLRQAIDRHAADEAFRAWGATNLGLAESQVLRPCFDADPARENDQPLALFAQDWWTLPCDGAAIRGVPPRIEGVEFKSNFQHELIRKVYTYNCMNAVFAYLGHLRGHALLNEAAVDPLVREVALAAWDESSHGLMAEYGFTPREQEEMKGQALRKYEDTRCPDPIERNARDSRRKLMLQDRLLGPAVLALKHGRVPAALALGVAAALHYDGSRDEGTLQVQKLLRQSGLRTTVEKYCGVPADSPLGRLIIASVPKLSPFNRRGIPLASS